MKDISDLNNSPGGWEVYTVLRSGTGTDCGGLFVDGTVFETART